MGWFTSLFGSTKAAETVVETAAKGIYNGIDKAWYTPEEASETFSNLLKLAYDDNSNRISVTDAEGVPFDERTTFFAYDELDRLLEILLRR